MKENKTKEHNPICWFIYLCISTVLLLVVGMVWNHSTMEKNQERILSHYDSFIVQLSKDTINGNRNDDHFFEKAQANEEAIKGILEQEYNKIQSEYESVEIWVGIVTVVFLIFSFYSLFKTETLERQSREAVHRIQEKADEWEKNEKMYVNQISELKEDMLSTLDEAKLLKVSLQKEFKERLKNTSDILKEENKKLSDQVTKIIEVTIKKCGEELQKKEEELNELKKQVDEKMISIEVLNSKDIDDLFNEVNNDGKEEK